MVSSYFSICIFQVWDYTSGKLIQDIPFSGQDHGEFLYVGRFLSSDVVVAGGSGTNDVKIISRKPYKVLHNLAWFPAFWVSHTYIYW
jgi:hypothetical protein